MLIISENSQGVLPLIQIFQSEISALRLTDMRQNNLDIELA